MHQIFTKQKIINILKKDFRLDLSSYTTVSIEKINEGYMNHCLKITFQPGNKKYLLIIYNSNRYSKKKFQLRIKDSIRPPEF